MDSEKKTNAYWRSFGYSELQVRIGKVRGRPLAPPDQCAQESNFFSHFRQYHEVESYLFKFVERYHDICIFEVAGQSVEKRSIYTMSCRVNANNENILINKKEAVASMIQNKKIPKFGSYMNTNSKPDKSILVTAGIHGREWSGVSSVLYSMDQLAKAERNRRKVANKLSKTSPQQVQNDLPVIDIVFIPLINPDGYEHTFVSEEKHTKKLFEKGKYTTESVPARLWRKNRARNSDGTIGVDLNRNFGETGGSVWGQDKKSKSITITSSDIYQGPKGFSEPETQTLRNVALRLKKDANLKAFYDVHCCIGALLEPSSFTEMPQALATQIDDVGNKIVNGINRRSTSEVKYVWQKRDPVTKKTISSGTGTSSSWGFQELQVPHTYVLELRGKFSESCTEIIPLGEECYGGLSELVSMVQLPNFGASSAALPISSLPFSGVHVAVYAVVIIIIGLFMKRKSQARKKKAGDNGKDRSDDDPSSV